MPASWFWHGWQVLLWVCSWHGITEKPGLRSTLVERSSGFDCTKYQFPNPLFMRQMYQKAGPFTNILINKTIQLFWLCCHQQGWWTRVSLGSPSSSPLLPSSWCSDLKDFIRSVQNPFKLIHIQSLDYFASFVPSSSSQVDCSGQKQDQGELVKLVYLTKNYQII